MSRRSAPLLALILVMVSALASTASAGSSLKSDERVVFFPTAAHWDGEAWVAPIHGWVFEPELGSIWRGALLRSLRSLLQVTRSQENFFQERAGWFLVDNERGKKIRVSAGGVTQRMPKSAADGHFRGALRLPRQSAGRILSVRALTSKNDSRRFQGSVLLVPQEGLSVISDIDDTIKITEVHDHKATLQRTFLEPFEAVPGMAALYREWRDEGAFFHYVSASPWHLFVPLSGFMQRLKFPFGTMHLRDFRLKDRSGWQILSSSQPQKTAAIDELLHRFPRRDFVLVGDSGENDPEIYADVARRHPGQVTAIYIRLANPGDMPQTRVAKTQQGLSLPVLVFEKASQISDSRRKLP